MVLKMFLLEQFWTQKLSIPEIMISTCVPKLGGLYQRSTTAISIMAPICYAHLAAAQMVQFIKFKDFSKTSSEQNRSVTAVGSFPVPELPRLHQKDTSSMFFC